MSVIVIVFGKCLRHNSLEHQKVKYSIIYIPIHKSEFLRAIATRLNQHSRELCIGCVFYNCS